MPTDTERQATQLHWVTERTRGLNSTVGKVLAHPGDFVTCPNGHPVYEVVEDVLVGASPKSSWFRSVSDGTHPISGVAPPCPECGDQVFPQLGGSSRFALFIDGRLVGSDP